MVGGGCRYQQRYMVVVVVHVHPTNLGWPGLTCRAFNDAQHHIHSAGLNMPCQFVYGVLGYHLQSRFSLRLASALAHLRPPRSDMMHLHSRSSGSTCGSQLGLPTPSVAPYFALALCQ